MKRDNAKQEVATQSNAAQSLQMEQEVAKAGLEARIEDQKLEIRSKDTQI